MTRTELDHDHGRVTITKSRVRIRAGQPQGNSDLALRVNFEVNPLPRTAQSHKPRVAKDQHTDNTNKTALSDTCQNAVAQPRRCRAKPSDQQECDGAGLSHLAGDDWSRDARWTVL